MASALRVRMRLGAPVAETVAPAFGCAAVSVRKMWHA